MKSKKSRLVVITGPTATGKTDLALHLAKKFKGELISCDSRQVYKYLDIGTGKYPNSYKKVSKHQGYWTIDGIKLHLYDQVDFNEEYNVARYILDAKKVIDEIVSKDRLPIVVGGSGLYLRALINGLDQGAPINNKLRQEWEKMTLAQLQNLLKEIDLTKFEKLNNSDRKNKRRLIRALEVSLYKLPANYKIEGLYKDFEILKIGLTTSREIMYELADKRVERRIATGLIEEGKNLINQGMSIKRMKSLGLEYAVLAGLISNEIKLTEFGEILKRKIRNFIKRQLTWFNKEKNIQWFDIKKDNFYKEVEKLFLEMGLL